MVLIRRSIFFLTLFSAFLSFHVSAAQEKRLNFFSLTRFDGLSNNDVTCFAKDGRGYVWIGTHNGLNRYNGYDFRVYQFLGTDTLSVPANHITSMQIDRSGVLWVGTNTDGLARYVEGSDDFVRYSLMLDLEHTAPQQVRDLAVDSANVVWAATAGGLFFFDRQKDEFVQILVAENLDEKTDLPLDSAALFTLSEDISAIASDNRGGVWVVYPDLRLSYLDLVSGKSIHYGMVEGEGSSFGFTYVNNLLVHEGLIYIGTRSHGLIVFDPVSLSDKLLIDRNLLSTATDMYVYEETMWISSFDGVFAYYLEDGTYDIYRTRPGDPKALSSPANHAVFVDDLGILWLAPINAGVNFANIRLPFRHLFEDPADISMLSHSRPTAVYHDSQGALWVGFQSGIIENFRSTDKQRVPVSVKPLRNDAGVGAIFRFFEDSSGDLYMTSWLGGLQKYNRASNRFLPVLYHEDLFVNLSHATDIRAIDEDIYGNLWLGIHGVGLAMYNRSTGKTILHGSNPADPMMLSNAYVFDLLFDDAGSLWVGTPWGLNRMLPGDTIFTRYLANGETGDIFSNHIHLIFKDAEGRMWFAGQGGISIYNPDKDAFHTISMETFGLSLVIIRSIMDDAMGNLWISSSSGIIRLDLQYRESYEPFVVDYHLYDVNHGVLSEDFFAGSASKDKEGFIYFGGTLGVDYFDPEEFYAVTSKGPVQIEEIRLYNRLIFPGTKKGPELDRYGRAVFSHQENMLGFLYVSLTYFDSQKGDYYYKLSPLHDEWQYAGKNRLLTFANLAPGEYAFSVKLCADADGCDELASSFLFVIRAPFWKTHWFILLMGIISLLILMTIQLLWSRNLRRKRITLERLVRLRTSEIADKNVELHKLNTLKNKLFSVLGHDLRSPVANMIGLIDVLKNNQDNFEEKKKRKIISTLGSSAEKHLLLVDNLLQWSVSQSERLQVNTQEVMLKDVIDNTFDVIRYGFVEKGVGFVNKVDSGLGVLADKEMLKVIVRNLLANAVKFTPSGGQVTAEAGPAGHQLIRIDISDTGVGIPDNIVYKLFKPEESVSEIGTGGEVGTGLGLILCRDFLERLGGRIWVSSTSPQGTTISFTIPKA